MKKTVEILCLKAALLSLVCMLSACDDAWSGHYDAKNPSSTEKVSVFQGTLGDYLQSQPSLSRFRTLYEAAGLSQAIAEGRYATAVVCDDAALSEDDEKALRHDLFAENTLSSMLVPPVSLTEGYGLFTESGKNLWVTLDGGDVLLNGKKVEKVIKTDNAYVYWVEDVIPVQPSLYDYIQSLGEEYSLFKAFLSEFEEPYFDAASSTPCGVDPMGNTVYSDSVILLRNTLMDRYTENGLDYWNMWSESFQSTLFVPDNGLLQKAYENALDSIPYWLNRSSTAADSLKFRKWLVSACFADRRLAPEEVAPFTPGQFACVGGHIREINETTDTEKFTPCDAAQWKPSVQLADYLHPVDLSNGVAYRLTAFKVPNHIVIWRAKSRFYEVWSALTAEQQGWNSANGSAVSGGYFRWNHWIKPQICNDAQTAFELSSTLPVMYYHVLTAEPDALSQKDSLTVSVDYDGLYYNSEEPRTYGLSEVHLPAGEYYLRMGFKHSLTYSISIWFCAAHEEFGPENLLVENMSLIATGSNFHFDRGGAMEGLDFYGSESIGYPEYYDWRWWYEQSPELYQKASAYDTDGYQVAVVNLSRSGNFKIRIASSDNARLYGGGRGDRTKNDVNQLMMYHWCLRPTLNNY